MQIRVLWSSRRHLW